MFGSSGKVAFTGGHSLLILVFLRTYNIVFGLFQAPYYAYSQTMMAELTPPGFDNMVRRPTSLFTSNAVDNPVTSFLGCSDSQIGRPR